MPDECEHFVSAQRPRGHYRGLTALRQALPDLKVCQMFKGALLTSLSASKTNTLSSINSPKYLMYKISAPQRASLMPAFCVVIKI